MPSLHLRPAVPEDAGELLSIYRPYVEHTAVTFEYAVPTPAPFLPFPQLGERTAGLLAPWATAAVW